MAKIRIGGRDLFLTYTVRARIEIGKLAGHSMQDFFNKIGGEDESVSIELMIDAVEILANAYERKAALEDGREYEPIELDHNNFYDLTGSEWSDIEQAIIDTITQDSKTTIETKPTKSKGPKKKAV